MKLLIVEDNPALLESMKQIMEDEFEVETATEGDEALYLAQQNIYDIILLDVMLPEMDGFTILKALRKEQIMTPVLFVTAKDALEDRVKGLEIGGDDYIVKPFQAAELKARIRASLRRTSNMTIEHTLQYRGIELFGKEKAIKVGGEPVKLTITQYELLEYLIQNSGNILTREQIFDRVWGFESDTTVAIVEVYIHHLRKKLEPFGYHKDIQNVRGIGYILKDPKE
ncbi:response regulator transcription factor [Heyndrickxia acidiproducens]|uniref:response regulator transcription factor n=1 Tax=Heyndrickxia acidiproducens TaxID=1121084 RepID=UPI0003645A20|nr:response regulator transcription factor [Heyndrickxia acidiproducens]